MSRFAAEWADGVAELGPEWDGCFGFGPGVQSRRSWFAATEEAALPPGARARSLLLRQDGTPAAVLPLLAGPGGAGSLTSPYSVLFQPLVDPAAAFGLGREAGRLLRRWPVLTLDALDPGWPGFVPFLAGLRRAGLLALRFDHFGNWHEAMAGRDWAAYLADRPGALRETIRRKSRLAGREGVRFTVAATPDALPDALDAYESVYARSWKVPEPHPHFAAALLRRLAPLGQMRLGVMWRGAMPLAAQYWTVEDGVATVLKLAHDDAAKALSPGTLLTAHMIRGLLDGGVRELDFGRGDDPYKRQWAGDRRQRIGVVLANPLHPRGLAAAARHGLGRLLKAWR